MRGEKDALRRRFLEEARQLDPDTRRAISAAACENLLRMPQYNQANTVFSFVGTGWEIDTAPILQSALAESLPQDPWDRPVDAIATESHVYYLS